MISGKIAEFAIQFELDQASGRLREIVRAAVVDTVGVMLGGSQQPAAQIMLQSVIAEGAAPEVSAVGHALRTSAQNAALLNGVATQALDYDLSFIRGSGQSTAPLLAGLLALAQSGDATPEELVSSYIVGAEVSARLVKACPKLIQGASWHGTGIVGVIAATTAYARLMGRPGAVIETAIGISASMASGIAANFGTMTKPLHTGLAARNAVLAQAIAAAGFTGNGSALESPSGYYAAYGRGLELDESVFDDLGVRCYLEELSYIIKPFACGGILHCAIEAALRIRERERPAPEAIRRIEIALTPQARTRTIESYPWSEDSARFCPVYLIPFALITGTPDLTAYSADALSSPVLKTLSEKCFVITDPQLSAAGPAELSPARVTVVYEDGIEVQEAVAVPPGSPDNPLSEERRKAKFLNCACQAIGEDQANAAYAYLSDIDVQDTLETLWPLTTPQSS